MSTLQQNSIKIKKLTQVPSPDEDKDFVCGECRRGYNSYPALRLHVKRRHNGIMPPNTKIVKTPRPALDVDVKSGRPLKQIKDIDELCKHDANIEMAENDLVSFLAEKLVVTSLFASKIPVADIVDRILAIPATDQDKWFLDIQEETKIFLNEHPEMRSKLIHLNFSEDFANLNFEKGLKVIVWVLIWLIQIYVRIEFTTELCLIFSKIWKVLQETELSVQDLDNKLVWKKVSKECENFNDLLIVNKDQNLLLILIQKICQLIGKATEDKNVLDS